MHRKVSCPGWWQTGTVQHWDGTKALSFPRGTNSPPDKSLQWIQELPRCQGDKRDEQQLCHGCSRHFLVSLISLRDWEKKIKRQRSSEIVVNWSLIESPCCSSDLCPMSPCRCRSKSHQVLSHSLGRCSGWWNESVEVPMEKTKQWGWSPQPRRRCRGQNTLHPHTETQHLPVAAEQNRLRR